MQLENSESIGKWREQFGRTSLARLVIRANKEMSELLDKVVLLDGDISPNDEIEIAKEIADVIICLHAASAYLGREAYDDVDAKMKINRARKWVADGKGCAQHVPGTGE